MSQYNRNLALFLLAATLWVWGPLFGDLSGSAAAASIDSLRAAVLKIQVTSNEPSFSDPWKRRASTGSSGTGFFIGDGRILTNAHVVANASFITVLRDGDSKPTPAFVKFIAHDSDLAMLEVEDTRIFEGVQAMTFGSVPKLRSPVATIGFPTGGEQLSITEGVVSRISYRRYVHDGAANHLLVQVDSAINPGNSGGPVVQGRVVVGVAFQSFTQAENTGYIIPVPVVKRFLKDVEDGRYDGHPEDGLTVMDWALLNPSAAAFHGLPAGKDGVKLAYVAPWAPAAGKLQAGDILLEIDDRPIGVDGKVTFQGERVDFRTVYDLKQMGEEVRFEIARDGKIRMVSVPIRAAAPHYSSRLVYTKHPRFFVYGGLVFTALSKSLLRTWGDRWWKDAPLLLRFFDRYAEYQPETNVLGDIIVLAKRLPDEVNAYATANLYGVVTRVDGKPVATVAEFAKRLETGEGEFAVVDFFGSEDPLVLSRSKVAARNADINRQYGVVPDRWFAGPEEDGAIVKEASK